MKNPVNVGYYVQQRDFFYMKVKNDKQKVIELIPSKPAPQEKVRKLFMKKENDTRWK